MKASIRFNNPWIIGIQGIIMIIFGIAAIVNPEITLKAITRFFGVLLLISGVFLLILTKSPDNYLSDFWFYEGVANVIVGVLFILLPTFIANIFVILIGLISLIIGIRNLWLLLRNKPDFLLLGFIRNSILVAFGLLFLFVPFQGAMVIINVIGFVALLYGIVTIIMAYKLLQSNKSNDSPD
ncbi:MAG: hypothetical protein C0597_12605 [Marinilabiliales bacterium]|nr:MAG: hypothetical protein C0597_12605 [Marinilabiliales bacterium]